MNGVKDGLSLAKFVLIHFLFTVATSCRLKISRPSSTEGFRNATVDDGLML
jgi:hypothetical protein